MDNIAQQVDEIEALVAIYGDELFIEDEENRAYSIVVGAGDKTVKLYVKLPVDYPSSSPPLYEISAPHLSHEEKLYIGQQLDQVYLEYIGQNVIYQWVEKIREELENSNLEINTNVSQEESEGSFEVDINNVGDETAAPVEENCPTIYHGEVIIDRKSSFQGHTAQVHSIEQVKLVLKTLLENRKIEQATHNIHAYRIYQEESKVYQQDCDDDGENQAGGRLLHFLQIIDAKNIVVVVSRWYGGIHLGPDRFRHINNAARLVLESANLIHRKREKK